MSHTPGPWKAMIRPDHGVVVVKGPNGVIIAQRALTQEQKRNDELYANARLIAAAPELYQVCWELEKLNPNSYAAEKARKIIAKLQREEGKKSE